MTKEFAEQIGADGWAPDAGSAVILARRLVAEARAARADNVAWSGEPDPRHRAGVPTGGVEPPSRPARNASMNSTPYASTPVRRSAARR